MKLNNCPQCGSKAIVERDIIDGFDFGWSVGCPRYRRNDGLHTQKMRFDLLQSKEEAVEVWNRHIEQLKEKE